MFPAVQLTRIETNGIQETDVGSNICPGILLIFAFDNETKLFHGRNHCPCVWPFRLCMGVIAIKRHRQHDLVVDRPIIDKIDVTSAIMIFQLYQIKQKIL